MIAFLGNCQVQGLAKEPVFAGLGVKWLLWRTPALFGGPGFAAAREALVAAHGRDCASALEKSGIVTSHPSLGDLEALAPEAVVVNMFHESPALEDRATGAVYNVLDCSQLRSEFSPVRAWLQERCAPLEFDPDSYPERFAEFTLALREKLRCPVVVILRLTHHNFFSPPPACMLAGWERFGQRARQAVQAHASADPMIRLVDMDMVAVDAWSERQSQDDVSRAFVPGPARCGQGLEFDVRRDLEHLAPGMLDRTAHAVLAALRGEGDGPRVRVPASWSEPAGQYAPASPEELARLLEEPVTQRQQRALLELLSLEPAQAGAILRRALPGLATDHDTFSILACNLALLPGEVARELLDIALDAGGHTLSGAPWRLCRASLAGKFVELSGLLADAGDAARAGHLARLALAALPSGEADVALARALLRGGKRDEALAVAGQAVRGGALDEDSAVELAGLLAQAGEPGPALEALAPHEASAGGRALRAGVAILRSLGQGEGALSRLDAAEAARGQDAPGWLLRERVATLYAMGRREEALSLLERADEITPALAPLEHLLKPAPAVPGRALVVRAGPLVAADRAVELLAGLGWRVEVLCGEESLAHFRSLPGVSACHGYGSGRYSHTARARELTPGVFASPYDLAVLVASVWDPEDYRHFLALMREIPAKRRAVYLFDQLWSAEARNRLLHAPFGEEPA